MRRMIAKVEGKVHLTQSKAKMAGTMGRTAFKINGVVKKTEKKKEKLEATKKKEAESKTCAGHAGDGPAAEAGVSPRPATQDQPTTGVGPDDEQAEFMAAADAGVDEKAATSGLETGQDSSTLLPGSLVMVRGLKASSELNDEVGMICGYDEQKDRYMVQLLSPNGGMKALKFENILLLQAPVDAEGFCGAGSSTASAGASGSGAGASGSTGGNASANGASQEGQWAPGGDDAEMANAFKDCMPLFHDSLWSATSLDIELTLSRVIHKVLRDMSVDKSFRRKRAKVLLRLGLLFQEPMRDQRQRLKDERAKPAQQIEDEPSSARLSEASSTSKTSKRSILARWKPKNPWWLSRRSGVKNDQKAREVDDKRKRMEGAIAMMAAGATTDDVDDMVAARAAMEAEFGEDSPFL